MRKPDLFRVLVILALAAGLITVMLSLDHAIVGGVP